MADFDIQMKHYNGVDWDNLYPITLDRNVFDTKGVSLSQKLANTVNSLNTKIDNTANSLNAKIGNTENSLNAKIDNTASSLNAKIDEKHQNVVTQLAENERNIVRVENKIERIKFSELQEPIYIAHRGGANIFPENTLEAYEGCLSMGVNVIELDVQQLADGALAVMHDTTMDRTTNRSGPVNNYSTMGFKRAKVDILPGWNDVHPPLLEEVLSRFGNNAIYIIESKDRKSAKKIA